MEMKILVEGMKCENCARHVGEALIGVDGIISAKINLADKVAIVEASSEVSNKSIELAVNTEKYKVIGIEVI